MKRAICLLTGLWLFKTSSVLAAISTTPEDLKNTAITKLNPGNITDVSVLMGRGITVMVAFMGTIALALLVFAGFLWMTAGGNETRIAKAQAIMIWTLLGTIIIGASYGFITFVIKIFG